MKVSVIIPNWNRKDLLRTCLKSLKSQTFTNFNIIVTDNGSIDGSVEYIRKYHSEIKLIKFKNNLGFSKAVNEGIKVSKSEFVFLLNNDTKLHKDCLKILIRSIESAEGVAGVAPKVLNYYNHKLIDSAGDEMNIIGQAFHRGYNEKKIKMNKPKYVFLITAGAGLFRKDAFKKIGYFDELFFAYSEDVDWCFRAQLAGLKFWYEPKAIVYHKHKATAKKIKRKVEYLQFRNMTVTIIKNFPALLFLKRFRFIFIPLTHLNTILFMFINGLFFEAVCADLWILKNIFRILKKRKKIQKSKVVSVNYLDSQMTPKKFRLWGLINE